MNKVLDKPQEKLVKAEKRFQRAPTPEEPTENSKNDGQSQEPEESKSQTTKLLKLVQEENLYLFHDQYEEAFVRMPTSRGLRTVPVMGEDFISWLGKFSFQKSGWAPGMETTKSVARQLEYGAKIDGPKHPLHVRVGKHNDGVYVDLDGIRSIRITPGNWKVLNKSPIIFKSYPHQSSLALPETGGNPWQFFEFVNIPEQYQLLMLVWLVALLYPGIPIPALVLHGPPGSAKTTTLKLAKRLVDPASPEVHGRFRDLMDFAQIASQNRLLNIDNLSSISATISDALCGSITGEGYAKRANYTDAKTFTCDFRCVIGLAGINLIPERSDLLDRSIIIPVPQIPMENRVQERDLYPRFEEARPGILGGLMDALSNAILLEKIIKLDSLPRMADFAALGCAISEAMGKSKADFLSDYENNRQQQHEVVLETDLCCQAVIEFLRNRDEWTGTAAELLRELNRITDLTSIEKRDRTWPKTAQLLSGRLNYLLEVLKSEGISVERPQRTGKSRQIILRNTGYKSDDVESGCYDAGLSSGVTPEPASLKENDANDANDDDSPKLPDEVFLEDMTTWPVEWEAEFYERFGILREDRSLTVDQAKTGAMDAVIKRFIRTGKDNHIVNRE